MYKGMDISGWNHTHPIYWKLIAGQDIKFVIEKITEGVTYSNPYFKDDYDSALAQGIVYDAYVFWHPSDSLSQQLGFARSHLVGTTAVPELDLELINNKSWPQLTEQAIAYLRAEPNSLLYANINFLTNMNYPTWPKDVRTNRLWLADQSVTNVHNLPYSPLIWQYSSTGKVAGISGNVDLNYFIDESIFHLWTNHFLPTQYPATPVPSIPSTPTPSKESDMYVVKAINTKGPWYLVFANPNSGEVALVKKPIQSPEALTAAAHIGVPIHSELSLEDLNSIATIA